MTLINSNSRFIEYSRRFFLSWINTLSVWVEVNLLELTSITETKNIGLKKITWVKSWQGDSYVNWSATFWVCMHGCKKAWYRVESVVEVGGLFWECDQGAMAGMHWNHHSVQSEINLARKWQWKESLWSVFWGKIFRSIWKEKKKKIIFVVAINW